MNSCVHKEVSVKSAAARFVLVAFLLPLLLPVTAFGQWSRTNLQAAANGTGWVTSNVTFAHTANAVSINAVSPIILRGNVTSNFATSVGNLTDSLLSLGNAQKTGAAATLSGLIRTQVDGFGIPAGLVDIQGDGSSRGVVTNNIVGFNNTRWIEIQSGKRLGLENLHFNAVTMENTFTYTGGTGAGGMTNGLIGNISSNANDIAMGDVIGNAFSDIAVILHGYRDTQYLAGGGIIGLRATGELAVSASAEIGRITGNVFREVSILTDQSADGGANGSAYIEGGGIIGVDAVSSPADIPGHARIDELSNNLFTDIKVRSDDIILGGGLVGVNNNSQRYDADTYSRIGRVSGNIFGNGVLDTATLSNSDIYVYSRYSLRGGGVIGVNGLFNAAVELDELTGNVFAGIAVESDSYLKGGGIVGLQSDDGGPKCSGDPCAPGTPNTAVETFLSQASDNLFLNAYVKVNTYLDGGGIIGLRSNTGMSALYELGGNIFKGLTVAVRDASDSNYLHGGGIVGVSS
ncbi:MAG: hypothetical protein LBJ59_05745, partial [Zoogloeaceae bacterium]|nr:hypothetical protein [Zoogloeaceae bacterium]